MSRLPAFLHALLAKTHVQSARKIVAMKGMTKVGKLTTEIVPFAVGSTPDKSQS